LSEILGIATVHQVNKYDVGY